MPRPHSRNCPKLRENPECAFPPCFCSYWTISTAIEMISGANIQDTTHAQKLRASVHRLATLYITIISHTF